MTMKKEDTWTKEDEHRLNEMIKRKERVHTTRMIPLINFADEIPFVDRHEVDLVAKHLAENADRLRDLLEPFDSGVRVVRNEVKGENV